MVAGVMALIVMILIVMVLVTPGLTGRPVPALHHGISGALMGICGRLHQSEGSFNETRKVFPPGLGAIRAHR
ncbi:MAG: hypothetical protein LBD96_06020, partial [Treponema sp.]|nr:hypothetical protein [Treponema sp.]